MAYKAKLQDRVLAQWGPLSISAVAELVLIHNAHQTISPNWYWFPDMTINVQNLIFMLI